MPGDMWQLRGKRTVGCGATPIGKKIQFGQGVVSGDVSKKKDSMKVQDENLHFDFAKTANLKPKQEPTTKWRKGTGLKD